jgi:hypothetical protein
MRGRASLNGSKAAASRSLGLSDAIISAEYGSDIGTLDRPSKWVEDGIFSKSAKDMELEAPMESIFASILLRRASIVSDFGDLHELLAIHHTKYGGRLLNMHGRQLDGSVLRGHSSPAHDCCSTPYIVQLAV